MTIQYTAHHAHLDALWNENKTSQATGIEMEKTLIQGLQKHGEGSFTYIIQDYSGWFNEYEVALGLNEEHIQLQYMDESNFRFVKLKDLIEVLNDDNLINELQDDFKELLEIQKELEATL